VYRLDNPLLFDDNGNIKSGSNRTETHTNALHIITVTNVSKMFSLPPDLKSLEAFWALSRHDIKDDNWEKLKMATKDVPGATMAEIWTVYTLLSKLVSRRKSQETDLPSISDEGCKLDVATQSFANAVCSMFLHISGLHAKKTYPTWDYEQSSYDVKLLIGNRRYVRPDGVIVYKLDSLFPPSSHLPS
jgi:hypothetical protein